MSIAVITTQVILHFMPREETSNLVYSEKTFKMFQLNGCRGKILQPYKNVICPSSLNNHSFHSTNVIVYYNGTFLSNQLRYVQLL